MEHIHAFYLGVLILQLSTTVSSECYVGEYTGTVRVSVLGIVCQRWDSLIPHFIEVSHRLGPEHSNYCRNPNGSDFLWCYTINSRIVTDRCNINKCASTTPSEVSTVTEQPTNVCYCPCISASNSWFDYFYGNLTEKEKDDIIKKEMERLRKELLLDIKDLSSYKRKKTCAKDNRALAVSMGSTLGVGVIAAVIVSVVLGDLHHLKSVLCSKKNNRMQRKRQP